MLTVTAISSGGNIGDTANCIFFAAPAATANDGDMTGDGLPDLTAVGAQAGLSSGLWLAHGTSDGQLTPTATDLGVEGTGANPEDAPSDWDGTQVITGHFNTGAGFNDVLDYKPAIGRGWVVFGSGDGSALRPSAGDQISVNSYVFTNSTGDTATSIASGGNLYHTLNGEPATGYPDVLLIVSGQLWDEPGNPAPGTFAGVDNALPLTGINPSAQATGPAGASPAASSTGCPHCSPATPALARCTTTPRNSCKISPTATRSLRCRSRAAAIAPRLCRSCRPPTSMGTVPRTCVPSPPTARAPRESSTQPPGA